jgi:heme/copper-type cytochrome/quinol oxidase subunit 4
MSGDTQRKRFEEVPGTGTGSLLRILAIYCGRCKGLGFTIVVGLGIVGVLVIWVELINPALNFTGVFGNETVPTPAISIRLGCFLEMGWMGEGGRCLSLPYNILFHFLVIIMLGKTSRWVGCNFMLREDEAEDGE